MGQDDEALVLAQRCRVLQLRFMQHLPHDALLLARIHLARTEEAEAREQFRWVQEECRPDRTDASIDVMLDLLSLLLSDMSNGQPIDSFAQSSRWDSLIQRAQHGLLQEQMIEVFWWRARQALQNEQHELAQQMRERALALLSDAPIWKNRLDYLSVEPR